MRHVSRSEAATLLMILATVCPGVAAQGQAHAYRGQVRGSQGEPIPAAHVFERRLGQSAITGSQGEFVIQAPHALDSLRLSIRKLGYVPNDTAAAAVSTPIVVILAPVVGGLDTVRTTARAGTPYSEYLDRQGYYARRARAGDATYVDRESIERRNVTRLSSLLQDVPGISISRGNLARRSGDVPLSRGRGCVLGLVVDGQRVPFRAPPRDAVSPGAKSIFGDREARSTPDDDSQGLDGTPFDEIVNPAGVMAIEVYPSAGAVPADLSHLAKSCGLIVVWTERAR